MLQHASLVKAINNIESPAKEKHVRNIILGSCFEKSVLPFWYNALKLDLFGNQIICWKFCYTVHRLVRDGYSTVSVRTFATKRCFLFLFVFWLFWRNWFNL